MLSVGKEVFVQAALESKRRVLHPAKVVVVGEEEGEFDLWLEEPIEVAADQELLLYYHKKRDFLKMPASVVGDPQTEPDFVFKVKVTGAAVSADQRECYRASTVIAGYTVKFGKEPDCPIMDVSATGFAVKSTQLFVVANTVNATLEHEGVEYSGKVCVQSVREVGRGEIRYGLSCLDTKATGTNLLAGIQKFSLFVQREQAKRLAGVS